MSDQPNPQPSFRELGGLVKNVNELAATLAAIAAVITFTGDKRLVSYLFTLLLCGNLDLFIWKRVQRRIVAIPAMVIVTLVLVGWVGWNAWIDLQKFRSPLLAFRPQPEDAPFILAALLLVLLLGWLTSAVFKEIKKTEGLVVPPAQPGESLILIAEFAQKGSKGVEPRERIKKRLAEEFQDLAQKTRIELVDQIADENAALRLGQKHNALFVIWGWYDDVGFQPQFTITAPGRERLKSVPLQEIAGEMEPKQFNLYIREGLPAQMAYLARFTIGQLYYWDEQLDQALRAFNDALADLEEARRVEGIPLPAGSSNLLFYRGYIYQTQGNLAQAMADWAAAIKLDPTFALAYYNRGVACFAQGKLDQAIAEYSAAIASDPKFPLAYNNRGWTLIKQGDYAQALSDLDHALALDPKFALALSNRGYAHQAQGNLAQAIADYSGAIAADPGLAMAYSNRSWAHYLQGDIDRALADGNHAVKLNPQLAIAYVNRSAALIQKNDLDRALADLDQAIALAPTLAMAFSNRSAVYIGKNRLDDAIADSGRAIALDPTLAMAYFNRGAAYHLQDNLAQAISDYDKAIALDPGYAEALFNRGCAYRDRGLAPQAIADLEMYLQLAPAVSERAKVTQWLGELKGQ